jgi:hypothetical protein
MLLVKFNDNFTIDNQTQDLGAVGAASNTKNTLHYSRTLKALYLINEKGLFELRIKSNYI